MAAAGEVARRGRLAVELGGVPVVRVRNSAEEFVELGFAQSTVERRGGRHEDSEPPARGRLALWSDGSGDVPGVIGGIVLHGDFSV